MKKLVYVAFLRGINVGGHHKVPMVDLKQTFKKMGFNPIKTVLNSGNILFEADNESTESLEQSIEVQLEKTFGFAVPALIRSQTSIRDIIAADPFKDIPIHKDIRLYVTFTKNPIAVTIDLPGISNEDYFRVIEVGDKVIYSVLDVSKSKTTDAMETLGKTFGKDITTRNWNTLLKVV